MIQTSHGLHKTVCVSYPRSGQSLIGPVLSDYFGDRFKYCEWYRDPEKRPNVCPDTNFVKTHDRDLNWHIREDWKYLVLIRNPIDAVSSWRIMDEENDYNIGWKLRFWAEWTNRWVIQPVPNRLIVSYESLVRFPAISLAAIVKFIDPTTHLDELEPLHDLIIKHNIKPRGNHAMEWLKYV